jgi:putative sterol carrier protein
LKIQLTGVVAVVLSSCGETFLFDWMGERLQLRAGPMENPDCIIHLTEQNLLQVASGDLNPQLGMLSDKIRVEGKLSFAVYFFNLVVPRGGGA